MEYRIVYSDELYHHGVKGMKWGVRKGPVSSTGIGSRRGTQTAPSMNDQARSEQRRARVKKAEARRDEFARDYAMKNYKPKR